MIKRITLTFSSFCSILFFTSIHVERKKQEVKRDLKKTISPISYLTIERILVHVNGNFRSKGNIEITFRKTVKQIVKLICKPIKKLFRKDYGWRTKINPERGGIVRTQRGRGKAFFHRAIFVPRLLLPVVILPVDNAVVITRRLQRGRTGNELSQRDPSDLFMRSHREKKRKKKKHVDARFPSVHPFCK